MSGPTLSKTFLNLGLHDGVHVVHKVRKSHPVPIDLSHVVNHLVQSLVELNLRFPSEFLLYDYRGYPPLLARVMSGLRLHGSSFGSDMYTMRLLLPVFATTFSASSFTVTFFMLST